MFKNQVQPLLQQSGIAGAVERVLKDSAASKKAWATRRGTGSPKATQSAMDASLGTKAKSSGLAYSDPKKFAKGLRDIEKATDWNDHGGARILAAKLLGLDSTMKLAKKAKALHQKAGGLSQEVIDMRKDIDKQLDKGVKTLLTPEQRKQFRAAF